MIAGLIPGLHPGCEGFGALGQFGNVPVIELAVEANAKKRPISPSYHRPAPDRSTVQYHCRSDRKTCLAIQLRAAGREVEELGGMTLSISLQKCR